MLERLEAPGSPQLEESRRTIGLDCCSEAKSIVDFIVKEGAEAVSVGSEYIIPDLVPGISTDKECQLGLDFLQRLDCLEITKGYATLDPITALCYRSEADAG